MDPNRQQFQVRPGEALGDKLIWRFPMATPEGRTALRPALDAARAKAARAGEQPPKDPQSVTVGYYVELNDPEGAPAFMPGNSPTAIAALMVPAVQRRIAEDLALRVERAPKTTYCERCERRVVPRMDRGDSLCPHCKLVL